MHNEADSLEEKSIRQIKHKATEPRSKEQKEKTRDSGLKCRLHFLTRRGQGILHGPLGCKGHRSKMCPEEVLTLMGADKTSTGCCCRGRPQLAHGAVGWFSAEGPGGPTGWTLCQRSCFKMQKKFQPTPETQKTQKTTLADLAWWIRGVHQTQNSRSFMGEQTLSGQHPDMLTRKARVPKSKAKLKTHKTV